MNDIVDVRLPRNDTTDVFVITDRDNYELCVQSETGRVNIKLTPTQLARLVKSADNARYLNEEVPGILDSLAEVGPNS